MEKAITTVLNFSSCELEAIQVRMTRLHDIDLNISCRSVSSKDGFGRHSFKIVIRSFYLRTSSRNLDLIQAKRASVTALTFSATVLGCRIIKVTTSRFKKLYYRHTGVTFLSLSESVPLDLWGYFPN